MDSKLGTFDFTKVKEVLSRESLLQKAPDPEPPTLDQIDIAELLRELSRLSDLNQRLRRKNRNQKIALRQLNDAMIRKSWNLGKALVDRQSLEAVFDATFGIKIIK